MTALLDVMKPTSGVDTLFYNARNLTSGCMKIKTEKKCETAVLTTNRHHRLISFHSFLGAT